MEAEDNVMNDELLFFKFDFTPSSFFLTTMMNIPYYANQKETEATRLHSTDPIYLRFHSTMVRQLHQRSFLEMILSSKRIVFTVFCHYLHIKAKNGRCRIGKFVTRHLSN
ncbi:hypothetical protein BCR42DRAFT_429417 [Absidia repens]|uniref:Uncharacterized protein n=1 Tax=Absidia repens TaxID=90262 RepID=A0A1X2HWS2_9FUNG|nr:hypothetical protein BCR42DRAFT_429417 [Absidia repens]